MKLSVVIPCYNEQEVLPELFRQLTATAEKWECDWEVLCVNDGSRDQTWPMILQQHEKDRRWRGLSLSRNFGHQAAISAGLFHASGDAVVVLDSDLQDPPEVVSRFLERWREGFEVVYGVRQHRKESVFKRACYWSFYRLLARLAATDIPLDSGDFCLMDRRVVDVLRRMPERNRFVRGLRAWTGFRQAGVEYERDARVAGDAKYTFGKLLRLALDGIFSFSTVPLALVAQAGLWISGLALVGIVWVLATKLFSGFFAELGFPPVQGFTTIVICILFLGGIQLLSIGIIGEYLGRVYDEVKRRPPWVIAATAGVDARTPDL
jgi:dolichol-phosphate mannosyltransferase